jgi:hypothetical protein
MKAKRRFNSASTMASRWRRRTMCVLIGDAPAPAGLREVSATGAFLETNARPSIGSQIELHHPEAGGIAGTVQSIAEDGIKIAFVCSEHSVAFALAAITSDMSNPPA